MTTQLKPCPWCNEPPRDGEVHEDSHGWWWVKCGNCGVRGPHEATEDKAREAWNDLQA